MCQPVHCMSSDWLWCHVINVENKDTAVTENNDAKEIAAADKEGEGGL